MVHCEYKFPGGQAAENIYTYVIGTVLIDRDELDVRLSGMTSAAGSENTPWIARAGAELIITFDGPPVFKEGQKVIDGTRQYVNL